jgi:hypothetical protein
MPFIEKKRRKEILDGKIFAEKPGDLCFLEYVPLMRAWSFQKRWTTIHNECKRMLQLDDHTAARFLAFLEFYIRHGHKYERKMSKKNGDIK